MADTIDIRKPEAAGGDWVGLLDAHNGLDEEVAP